MLIEFSVSNFLSFRERQTFSMVAAQRLRKKDCVFTPNVLGEKLPDLLKVVAIYGPNASGKSNLLRAIETVQKITRNSPASEFKPLPVSPFRFDNELLNEPSRFEFHFIQDRQRYQFELALTESRIVEEKLIAYPRGVETLLYARRHNGQVDVYEFGEELVGGSELHRAWQLLTGPQVLFITQAVANSNEQLTQLRPPLKWLQNEYSVYSDDELETWSKLVRAYGARRPIIAADVSRYLQSVDVPITNILFEMFAEDGTPKKASAADSDIKFSALTAPGQKTKTTFTHTTALGSADFDFEEESRGTRNLLGFYMPWSLLEDHTLFVDELDSSLHPKIVAALVKKHLQVESRGQLIFTTHDTHLMDTKLLRRDQFWLTERDPNGATRLRSVYDFHGREGEDVEKRYFEGHYRALPKLP